MAWLSFFFRAALLLLVLYGIEHFISTFGLQHNVQRFGMLVLAILSGAILAYDLVKTAERA